MTVAALGALLGAGGPASGWDRGGGAAPPAPQQDGNSEAPGLPEIEGSSESADAVRAAYHAVLDAAIGARDLVVAELGRAPWGVVEVLRQPDFDRRADEPTLSDNDMQRDQYETEVAVTRAAAAALREAGVIAKLAELARAVEALSDDEALDLSGTYDLRAGDAGRMLMCLAVEAELAGNGDEARAGEDDYVTIIAGLDAMARAQFQASGDDAYRYNMRLLRLTDRLIIDAIAAGHMSAVRARALLRSARIPTDDLRERYLDKVTLLLPPESRENIAKLWHATRDARRVALAIEVYRRRRGAPPMSLDGLAPDVLAERPRDPWAWNGKYKYSRDESNPFGYRLYSVGPDGLNDWGVRDGIMPTPEPGTDQLLIPES